MQNKRVKQNTQYTFKYNTSMGRHGWLRLTPAYSVRLVEEILSSLDYLPKCVLEPFSGTGTTELVCANKGVASFALEINPFLVWLGNTKLKSYSSEIIEKFLSVAETITENIESYNPAKLPPIYNIYRWWGEAQAEFLAKLKSAIKTVEDNDVRQLLCVAFCRIVIELSNAAFNHVSTSFKESNSAIFSVNIGINTYLSICNMVAHGASIQPLVSSKVLHHDSRSIPEEYIGAYDTVITSPPYPNRISYIRELRPYMYWADFLETSEQASELDWQTIGGTWGKATSLLSTWESDESLPQYVYDIAQQIADADNKSAGLMANYVLKYFEDMRLHLSAVYDGLKSKGKVFYIIGNSNFYGVTVPAERIYIDLMKDIGFVNAEYSVVRKRNCNKQLYEFLITAEKPSFF